MVAQRSASGGDHGHHHHDESPTTSPRPQRCVTDVFGGSQQQQHQQHHSDAGAVVIVGGGIVGLVLALALHTHCGGVRAEIYDKTECLDGDVGAGMTMYPNGLRVIRDVSPALLQRIREAGCEYAVRKWERHDGTEVMVAQEAVLADGDEDLHPIGIRRFQLQQILLQAVRERGIPIYCGKKISHVTTRTTHADDGGASGKVHILFEDGTSRLANLLFAADGSKSKIRQLVTTTPGSSGDVCGADTPKLEYTGTTCIMGLSSSPMPERSIRFPASTTTQCHAAYFPTRPNQEQCFQIHLQVPQQEADPGNWGTLTEKVGQEECRKMADRLEKDGWDESFLTPLRNVTRAVRIGFCLLSPQLERWVYSGNHEEEAAAAADGVAGQQRIVLVGDAAHPPVPYTGQGAQMGLEDAGVLALLLRHLCCSRATTTTTTTTSGQDNNNSAKQTTTTTVQLDVNHTNFQAGWDMAMRLYQEMRIPRTRLVQELSDAHGHMQHKRASSPRYELVQTQRIQRQVFFHQSLPELLPGVTYDYLEEVMAVLRNEAEAAAASPALWLEQTLASLGSESEDVRRLAPALPMIEE